MRESSTDPGSAFRETASRLSTAAESAKAAGPAAAPAESVGWPIDDDDDAGATKVGSDDGANSGRCEAVEGRPCFSGTASTGLAAAGAVNVLPTGETSTVVDDASGRPPSLPRGDGAEKSAELEGLSCFGGDMLIVGAVESVGIAFPAPPPAPAAALPRILSTAPFGEPSTSDRSRTSAAGSSFDSVIASAPTSFGTSKRRSLSSETFALPASPLSAPVAGEAAGATVKSNDMLCSIGGGAAGAPESEDEVAAKADDNDRSIVGRAP